MTPEQKQALQEHIQAMPAAGYAYASSTTNTIKLNKFVRLVLERLNLPLNRLTVELRFQKRNGNEKMCLKFLPIAVLTSMDYCQFKPLQKLRCSQYKLAFEYDLTYESKRSYYDLFDAAGISCQKTTSLNPKADEDAVAAKKKRLKHWCLGIGRKSKQES